MTIFYTLTATLEAIIALLAAIIMQDALPIMCMMVVIPMTLLTEVLYVEHKVNQIRRDRIILCEIRRKRGRRHA